MNLELVFAFRLFYQEVLHLNLVAKSQNKSILVTYLFISEVLN